jgi:uncharacterized protein YbgA (DUF1722 family)/uncharacterized protein YbbK (DUF523 family)
VSEADAPLRVGISACLLGRAVRFDGGHKRDDFAADVLAPYVEYVPVCPEVDIGLGVPRPTIRLEGKATRPRLIEPATRADHTAAMEAYAARKVDELAAAGLDGYILKRASPTCGMERVKLYPAGGGPPSKQGVGLFAAALLRRLPHLPVEEEGRLCDARLRDNFVERLFAHRRVRQLFAGAWTVAELVRFHTAEKMLLLAHDEVAYRALGRLVAGARRAGRDAVAARYQAGYMAALARIATPRRHANVLQHMAGHLKALLDAGDRAELAGSIDEHRRGLVPLVVPITLLRHHARRHQVSYLLEQRYLEPHPRELMLRNHV